ncbi:7085_t:CDS:2, partial [Dentiscutata erythropus]
ICEYEFENSIIPPLDCDTQWNSTYTILKSTIKMKKVVIRMGDHDRTFPDIPTEDEWSKADKIYTLKASANAYSTHNNTFASILNIHTHLCSMKFHTDGFIRNVSKPMIEKFNKYWEDSNFLSITACILDSHYKLQFISFFYREKEKLESDNFDEKIQNIRKKFENIYLQTYYALPAIERSTNYEVASTEDNILTFEDHINDFFEYTIRSTHASENNMLCEVNQYLDEKIADRTTNVLEWWKLNKDRFPTLSTMAQDFLAIPSTSVASEQMFSSAGHIIADTRTSLDPDTIAALMCQRNWLEAAAKFEWEL